MPAAWQSDFAQSGGWAAPELLQQETQRKRFGVPRAASVPLQLLGELAACDHPFQQAAVLAQLQSFMAKRVPSDAAANRRTARAGGCVAALVPLLRAADPAVAGGGCRCLQAMTFDVSEAVDELLVADGGRGLTDALALLRRPESSFRDDAAAERVAAAGLLQNATAASQAAVSVLHDGGAVPVLAASGRRWHSDTLSIQQAFQHGRCREGVAPP